MIDLLDLPSSSEEILKIDLSTLCPLEGIDSISLSLISFEGKSFSITFQSKEEILEGLSMACESLCNGKNYYLEDCQTSTIYKSVSEIKHINHNGTYKLRKDRNPSSNNSSNNNNNNNTLTNVFDTQYAMNISSLTSTSCAADSQIDESFLRKYENPFEVNLLREATVALTHMNFGEFFYECTSSSSKIKITFARLDTLRQELQIFSRKHITKRIPIHSITSITPATIIPEDVRKNLNNKFQQTSLTLTYKQQGLVFQDTKHLVFTFRTERQFDVWTAGLKAAVAASNNEQMSKKTLLQHSRLFNKFLKSNAFGLADSFFNNSAIYQEHLTKEGLDYPTYETSLLDRRITFCFEKQMDEFKNESATFQQSKYKKYSSSADITSTSKSMKETHVIAATIFENMSKISSYTIKQIQQMKQIIDDLQRAKSATQPVTKDLLEISSHPISREESELLEEEQRLQNIQARAKKIKYFYQEIFKFQYRLDQSNLLLSYFNKPPKR